jgi:hypothetical protein
MEHKNTHLKLVADNETKAALDSVAAAIHPLPQDLVPSQEFLGELRMRLMELEPGRTVKHDSKRAA